VPNHACAAVNLARELVAVEDGQIQERWEIDARG
jgi:D-serine deaminase-like pyridoxal phosphate-dependent protein